MKLGSRNMPQRRSEKRSKRKQKPMFLVNLKSKLEKSSGSCEKILHNLKIYCVNNATQDFLAK